MERRPESDDTGDGNPLQKRRIIVEDDDDSVGSNPDNLNGGQVCRLRVASH